MPLDYVRYNVLKEEHRIDVSKTKACHEVFSDNAMHPVLAL